MGKGEIARYEQFLLFPQCFQKACFLGASKGVIVWEWVNTWGKGLSIALLGKDKMLVSSILSFSHNVFYHIKDNFYDMHNIVVCKGFQFWQRLKFCRHVKGGTLSIPCWLIQTCIIQQETIKILTWYKQFLIPTAFSKDMYRIRIKTRACLGKG